MTHYFTGVSGDSFADATIHKTDDCPELAAPVRPLHDDSVPTDADCCPECSGGDEDTETADLPDANDKSDALLIEAGECPWCDGYEGDHVGQHASSAHPEQWAEYTDD